MTTINMFLHVLVYGTYFFYLRFVHIHDIFNLFLVVYCAVHARSNVEVQNILPYSYI